MRKIETQIEINAAIEDVWQAISDLSSYQKWNPFIVNANGHAELGETIVVQMHIPGKGFQTYSVRLTKIQKPYLYCWLGHFHIPGLIDGSHGFELSVLSSGRVRVRQFEEFRGLLVPFVWQGFILRHLLPCFDRLNLNLAAWCEGKRFPCELPLPKEGAAL